MKQALKARNRWFFVFYCLFAVLFILSGDLGSRIEFVSYWIYISFVHGFIISWPLLMLRDMVRFDEGGNRECRHSLHAYGIGVSVACFISVQIKMVYLLGFNDEQSVLASGVYLLSAWSWAAVYLAICWRAAMRLVNRAKEKDDYKKAKYFVLILVWPVGSFLLRRELFAYFKKSAPQTRVHS